MSGKTASKSEVYSTTGMFAGARVLPSPVRRKNGAYAKPAHQYCDRREKRGGTILLQPLHTDTIRKYEARCRAGEALDYLVRTRRERGSADGEAYVFRCKRALTLVAGRPGAKRVDRMGRSWPAWDALQMSAV